VIDSQSVASRRRETVLLALASAFVLAAAVALALLPFARANTWKLEAGSWGLGFWISAAVWAACALTSVLVLRRTLPDHDPYLLPIIFLLTGWGQRLNAEGDVPPHVDLVLSKPPKLRDLRQALASCVPVSPVTR